MRTIFTFIGIAVLLTSCGATYSEADMKGFDDEIKTYIKENGLHLEESGSGLYYRIDSLGSERKVQFTDKVSFTYKGTLLDGTVFDEQKEPVTFEVKQLIGCWKEIMLELGEGGKAYLISPPQLGYGAHDLEKIPKNSILIFELEVTAVQ